MNDFEKFAKNLFSELKHELPGFSAQKLMAPLGRKPPSYYLNEKIVPKKSAVLILIYPSSPKESLRTRRGEKGKGVVWAEVAKTVLIERTDNEGIHAGQISFPGGQADETDENLSATALREAEEEIGVNRKSISIIGVLTPLYIPVSNYMVHPFIGIANATPVFTSHTAEVKNIIEIEINEFISDKNKSSIRRHIKIINTEMEVPCYNIRGKIIWGATAMLISELSEIIRRIK